MMRKACSACSGWRASAAPTSSQRRRRRWSAEMTRRLAPGRLVIASHTAGKVREIRALVEPFGIEPVSARDLGLPEPEDTGTAFREDALLQAHAGAAASGLPALADD